MASVHVFSSQERAETIPRDGIFFFNLKTYKDVMAKAGKIPGLRGRWLAHAVDDPDAGYTMSLCENEAAMRSYENGEILQTAILPRLKPFCSGDYTTTRCEVRFAEEFDQ